MFDIQYSRKIGRWVILRDGHQFFPFGYCSEWEAIAELRHNYPQQADTLLEKFSYA